MPELEYFVVAESYAHDRDTNSISIFNVLNERKYDNFPVTIPRLLFISCWIATPQEIQDKSDAHLGIRINAPGHQNDPFLMNFTCDVEFQHLVAEYSGLVINQPSTFKIELLLNGEYKASHTLAIKETAGP